MKHLPTIALALCAASCAVVPSDAHHRVGVISATFDDDLNLAQQLDVNDTKGAMYQVSMPVDGSPKWALVAGVDYTFEDGDNFGVDTRGERGSAIFGAERRWGDETGYLFVQGGAMISHAVIEVNDDDTSSTPVGGFIAFGGQVQATDDLALFVYYRPIEPEADFDGLNVESETIGIGVGFKR